MSLYDLIFGLSIGVNVYAGLALTGRTKAHRLRWALFGTIAALLVDPLAAQWNYLDWRLLGRMCGS